MERTGVETIFVIEVENQNQEIDLYYSADGTLIKSIVDTDDAVSYTHLDVYKRQRIHIGNRKGHPRQGSSQRTYHRDYAYHQ